jgi:hypothetical protein
LNSPSFDKRRRPIIVTGALKNPEGKRIKWSKPLFRSNQEPIPKGGEFLRQNGKPITGPSDLCDKDRHQINQSDGRPTSRFLLDFNNKPISSPNDFFGKERIQDSWKEALQDSAGHPLSGTGDLKDSKGTPISWTGGLSDSQGTPINSPGSLFDEKGRPLKWEGAAVGKNDKLLLGTEKLTDLDGNSVSWTDASSIHPSRGTVSSSDRDALFDTNGNKLN